MGRGSGPTFRLSSSDRFELQRRIRTGERGRERGWLGDGDAPEETELILAALEMALAQRRPEAVIHHSDRGSQGSTPAMRSASDPGKPE
jgi:transposase InsO family protein